MFKIDTWLALVIDLHCGQNKGDVWGVHGRRMFTTTLQNGLRLSLLLLMS